MSDSSPIFRRKPRHKAPIIKDSPKSPPSKNPVPPSPVVPENDSVSATSQRERVRSRSPSSPASQQGIAPLGVPSVVPAVSMSDSSPIFQRKPPHKAPIIEDSPKSPPSKKPVPPSPVVPEIGSAEPSPLSPASQAKKLARRQKQLTTQFFGWGTGFRVL